MRSTRIGSWHRGVAISIAAVLAILAAGPVSAYNERISRGENGDVLARGGDGVVCHYRNLAGTRDDDLLGIRVLPIRVRGPREDPTVVGYRFIVMRGGGGFNESDVVYRSPVMRSVASTSLAARFPARYWASTLMGADKRNRHTVHLVFFFYEPGTWGKKVGKSRGIIERHRWESPGLKPLRSRIHCSHNFHSDPGTT